MVTECQPIVLDQVNPELMDGARNAIETCLAVLPRERVALIFDEPSREVAASLWPRRWRIAGRIGRDFAWRIICRGRWRLLLRLRLRRLRRRTWAYFAFSL